MARGAAAPRGRRDVRAVVGRRLALTGADDGGIVRWRARGDALARDDAGAWRSRVLSGHTRRVNALEHVPVPFGRSRS